MLIHHPLYGVLAATVAVLGSWTALDLFLRVRVWVGQPRAAWLIAATLAMGLSVWAMHFVAMLAFGITESVRYDSALTALALALALGSVGFAFAVAGSREPTRPLVIGAGLVMGAGLCLMHYVGISALRSTAVFAYDPVLVIASFLIAVGASIGVLTALGRGGGGRWRMAAALVMGAALLAVHFSAIASVRLLPGVQISPSEGVGPLGLAVAVTTATLFVLFLASLAALFDRRFEAVAAVEAKRSEGQLRAILDQMPVGIIVCDAPSGEPRFFNPEAEHLIGRKAAPGPIWAAQGLLGQDSDRPEAPESSALYRAVRLGHRTQSELMPYTRPDGVKLIIEQTAAPIRDANGRIVQGVLAFHDVTAKVKAEKALRQSQRMEGIGQLTGGVAHDFNNLLTAILGSLDLAQRRVDDERARQLIDNAVQAARRGARLTEQLLAFSRRQRLEPQPTDVNAMIARMSGLFSSTLGGTVKVKTSLKDDLAAASADPAQLELALLNLALNARDAMPEGGELSLTTSLATLGPPRSESEPGQGRYVCINASDTGRGMSAEVAARAFEPFFTTKVEGKGSGLGLSQVLGLAKQLGGGVRIDTVEGQGCAVTIYLPVSPEPAAAPALPQTSLIAHKAAIEGARVLLVDDDDDVRRFVADLLTESGCTVRTEADGVAGLNALDDGPYDLMVLDFAMPGMTGAEVARVVRERKQDLPILIMTGYLEHEAVLAQLGAQPILQKPFEPGELLARIAGTLRRSVHTST